MSASEKFKVGDRVRLTQKARNFGITLSRRLNRSGKGAVRSVSRTAAYLSVQPDGYKSAIRYHADFWESCED